MAGAPAQAYAALAAATVPFLAVNLPPARAFMGDVGAVPLGFLAAAFGIAGWRAGVWPAWFPLLVFLPFVVGRDGDAFRRRSCAASACGRRTGRTITSGCTSWARGIAALSPPTAV